MNQAITTVIAREASADLLTNDIDSRIVKIRPTATPVDTPPGETEIDRAAVVMNPDNELTLSVKKPEVLSSTDTILIPDAIAADGQTVGVVLYVESVETTGVKCRPAAGVAVSTRIPSGAKVIRMGRAAAEMDVQTTHAQALPVKKADYCQIFKAQVEQSMLMRHSAKEVGWTLTDQQEVALIDMRLGMEKNFLFGVKHRFDKGASSGEVFMTEGIWNQTPNTFYYDPDSFGTEQLVKLSRRAFTGNAGSTRKILIAGSGFIEHLSSLPVSKAVGAQETVTRWGIDFTEFHTKFGRLYVVLSEIFDICGHENDAMVIDPEYLQKYTHTPFRAMPIDLVKSGQRNSEAVVLTEASCLVLRYPMAHMRIIARRNLTSTDEEVQAVS